MYVVCVTIFVKPEHVKEFIEATKDNHLNTRHEPGNVRFDVLQSADDPTRFFLYEAYKTAEGFTDHQKTEHYIRWKARVAEWMAKPREGVKHKNIFPEDLSWDVLA